ncbi:secreted RxLR effector protein 161-like [Pyrus communis]|uniref:secreted RxLR effector protein 161-like n=1 Tax=Pyrus communis TaxID=23211 RepID=UPI0035C0685A
MDGIPYANLVGGLMYAMVCTCPDIAHATEIVSRFMHNPGRERWNAAKWILRYLHGTKDKGTCFERCDEGIDKFSVGYVDSDLAGDLDKRRSTFTMAKGPICWRSILQPTTALSTTKAEYMAIAEAIKEVMWTLGLLGDLGVEQHKLDEYCDSQSAIYLAKYQLPLLERLPQEDGRKSSGLPPIQSKSKGRRLSLKLGMELVDLDF